ncbi:MAG: hypothetical protein IPK99_05555 [Flavobacteriales bacterium]|nr:hypothetical protein [Flavobacteriales bacterium]
MVSLSCTTTSVQLIGGSLTIGATFSWSGPNGFNSTDVSPFVSAPGLYTLTVTGPNGCTNTASVEVEQDISSVSAGAVWMVSSPAPPPVCS